MLKTISTPIPGVRRVPVWLAALVVGGVAYWWWQQHKEPTAPATRP